MKRLLCILGCLCAPAWSDNLLSNPGFDSIEPNGSAKAWDVFVMPMDGAVGELDIERHDGDFAAMLYTPEPYPKDPINNWSQVIYDDLSNQELWVSGSIRVEDATEAAIWLQCFQNNPTRVLASVSTETEFPVYGTQGWAKVNASLNVPARTDFIVVRCVLKGTGRAWFDSLHLSTDKSDHIPPEEATQLEAMEPAVDPDNTADSSRATLEELLEVTLEMQNAIQNMESTNDALVARIESMRRELALYKNELSANQDILEQIEPAVTYGPPLVPFGYYLQER